MLKTVNDMYNVTKKNDVKLLSNYTAPFWNEYNTNYKRYDALFRRRYLSFIYFLQDSEETVDTVTNNFIEDVYNHLLVNDKKYSELYRIHVINDADYSLTENYNMTEIMDRETSSMDTNIYGARSDEEAETLGSRNDTGSEIIGSRNDSGSELHGAHNENVTETIGSRNDTGSEIIGSRNDTGSNVTGSQNNVTTNKVSPYDNDSFHNNTQDNIALGDREDSNTFTQGEQSNSNAFNQGEQTNTKITTVTGIDNAITHIQGEQNNSNTFNKGEQNNSTTFTKGSQTDSLDNDFTEDYTLTKHGNIGIQSVTDLLNKHKQFWTMWDFYEYIFNEISKDLLMV